MTGINARLLKMAEQQADICQTFGNVTRILIVWTLNEQEMRVSDIAEAIGASLQNTSQHLRLMRDRGMLTSRRKGQAIYYRIDRRGLMEGCAILCGIMQTPLHIDESAETSPRNDSAKPILVEESHDHPRRS
jgi:DNA-binding transcriptional ArsR family regulator